MRTATRRMLFGLASACVLLIFSSSADCGVLLQVTTATQQQGAKGTIEGTVVQARNGAELPGVRVLLTRAPTPGGPIAGTLPSALSQAPPAPPPPPLAPPLPPGALGTSTSTFVFGSVAPAAAGGSNLPSATTDSQGHFVVKDVEPGTYRVTFAMNGYVKQDYGQRSITGGQGVAITVIAGKSVKDINMSMSQTGNLSGRIRDTSGVPAAGVPIQLLRATFNASGQKSYSLVSSDKSDDRGEYRLYWLSPGRYYLNAGTPPGPTNRPIGLGGGAGSPNQVPGESFTSSYFPGVINISQAVAIDIGPGMEVGGIDFAVTGQQLLSVRGKVVDTRTGAPPAAVSINLSYQSFDVGGSFGGQNNYNATTGTFEITNVIPGAYSITSTVQDNTVNDPIGRAKLATATLPIELFSRDVESVVMQLVAGNSLPGKIVVEGKQPPAINAARLTLRPSSNGVIANTIGVSTPPVPTVDTEGNFRFEGVRPGEFRLSLTGMPPDYYLKDVRLNREDALNKPMQFPGGDNAFLDVTIASGAVEIQGTALDSKTMPESGVAVVLIPDQHRDRIELYRNATTDVNGKFGIRSIPPGNYKLFAWDSLETFAWYDPEILARYEGKGKAVHVIESVNQTVELKVITEP